MFPSLSSNLLYSPTSPLVNPTFKNENCKVQKSKFFLLLIIFVGIFLIFTPSILHFSIFNLHFALSYLCLSPYSDDCLNASIKFHIGRNIANAIANTTIANIAVIIGSIRETKFFRVDLTSKVKYS